MALTLDQITRAALTALTPEERKSSAVYLDEAEVKAGSTVEIDRKLVQVRFDTVVVFVDMEPQANWGHACRYLLVDRESGATESISASYPPFLTRAPKTLRLIWKGEDVPDWALAVHP